MLIYRRREKVLELYNQEKSVKEIAEEVDVNISTIYSDIKYLKEIGKIQGRVTTKERQEKVVELYSQGKSVKKIAEELGVSRSTTYVDIKQLKDRGKLQRRAKAKTVAVKKIQEEGVGLRGKENVALPKYSNKEAKKKLSKEEKVIELYNQGRMYGDIAEQLNIPILEVIEIIQNQRATPVPKTYKEEIRNKIMMLYNEGNDVAEISEKLKLTEAMVKEQLTMLGVSGLTPKLRKKMKEVHETSNSSCQKSELQSIENKEKIEETIDIEAARKLTKEYLIERLREFLALQEYDKINEWIDVYRDNPFLTDLFKQKLLTFKKEVERQRENDKTTTVKGHVDEER